MNPKPYPTTPERSDEMKAFYLDMAVENFARRVRLLREQERLIRDHGLEAAAWIWKAKGGR
jgi:hypothetical protein